MCGILGILGKGLTVDKDAFKQSLDLMHHRGPDGSGTLHNVYASLGHRRLSIIDLSAEADQPFVAENGKLAIVFNGEIYNYREISADLPLRTSSDTEVLLKGYAQYGIPFFNRIRGIYSFSIYDARGAYPRTVMLRDPAGVKPFYYFQKNGKFIFASEIKSILPFLPKGDIQVNETVIRKYIHLGYCPEPETAYQNIFALEPGVCYTFSHENGRIERQEVLKYSFKAQNTQKAQAIAGTEKHLQQACKRNMVADVEVNVALSGGIDSSLIYALANRQNGNNVKGITVAFDERDYDESPVARKYAEHLRAPHIVERTEAENKLEMLNQLLHHFDQPYADSSFIPFYFLCRSASRHSKVLIGGDSGDEIHNGYSGFQILPIIHFVNKYRLDKVMLPGLRFVLRFARGEKKRMIRKAISLLSAKSLNELLFRWESWFPPDSGMYPFNPFQNNLNGVAQKEYTSKDFYSALTEEYFHGRMQSDYLRKSDMMSMLNSLEFRVPMLDEDLTRYSLSLPFWLKSNLKQTKAILRKIHRKIFPKELSELPKKGFTIPLDNWLGEENLKVIKAFLLRENCFYTKYIKEDYVVHLFDCLETMKGQEFVSRAAVYQRILIIYSLEFWYTFSISNH